MAVRGFIFLRGFILLICLSAFLSGCATPAGRSAGAVIDDAVITSKVNALIIEEKDLKFLKINVDTFKGIVTLMGTAPSAEAEKKLIGLAKGVSGVKDVVSKLRIEPGK